ncbi:MAG TPA: xanthine dehydrogenase family protein molybdopterin-binding subunit, partial [Woeseiaceae bacterium]|nr:xanthine dehydrogenase family protein molybdopterin-binding subunit [Woeseiaceae bacterium]
YTHEDLEAAGVKDLPGAGLPPGPDGKPRSPLMQRPLARDHVRYVGEPVAAVLADSVALAKDAAELIELELDELEAVVMPEDAVRENAPRVHDSVPENRFGTLGYGDRNAADEAFTRAAHTVEIEVRNNRLAPTAMEPRGCNVTIDPETGRLTLYQGCQGAHFLRDRLSEVLGLAEDSVHVIAPDVGGGFGLKYFLQCETVLAAFACRATGRPVKWIADRGESFLSDLHGRDHVSRAELAIDDKGRFLGLRATINANIGAYCSQAGPMIPWFGACMSTGVYDIPVASIDVHMIFTNTVPIDAYRGAGRPEAAYLIERLVDKAARRLGVDAPELRRRNFIRSEQFPYETPTGTVYDSGDYVRLMDGAMNRADWADFAVRREKSASQGRLRGIGMSCYVEICSVLGGEQTHVRFEENGRVTVLIGTQSTGQGHETSYAQMVAAALEVDIGSVDIVEGDTARVPSGAGTVGSRSMVIGGSALYRTVESLIDSGRRMAAEMLEAAAVDVEFAEGRFTIAGTDRSIPLAEVARGSFHDPRRPEDVQPGLASSEEFLPDAGTFPNGCHICEVEVDPDTGVVDILRYTVEDDVGTVINPLILEGQIVGGIAQGLGQAMGEHAVYDPDSGQLLTASFQDYPMPRADWIPPVDFGYQEVPSPRNPLGIKGAGEAGTIGATPALVNAVLDALAGRGIEHLDMPLTPLSIWQRLHTQANGRTGSLPSQPTDA